MRYFITCYVVFILSALAGPSCKETKKDSGQTVPAKPGLADQRPYNFDGGEERLLSKKLKEISGLHYVDGDRFVAIQDELGVIYTIDYKSGEIVAELRFAGAGDYEDITINGDYYYVLESSGKIYQVPIKEDRSKTRVFSLPGGKNNFESIYLDATGENLIVVCKECGTRELDAYAFNISKERFSEAPLFTIKAFATKKTKDKKRDVFRPSAAAIHPIEKKLYVLCSVGNSLLVCDVAGNIEEQFHLDPALYRQPEGIAFMPNGDLFISNEAAGATATIVKLKYHPG